MQKSSLPLVIQYPHSKTTEIKPWLPLSCRPRDQEQGLKETFLFLSVGFFLKKYLFFAMLGLCCCMGFSLVAVSRCYSLVAVHWLLIEVASCCRAWSLGHADFPSYHTWSPQSWLPGSRTQAQQLYRMNFVALQHVGSFCIKSQTLSCIGRWILYH